jgi:hypothetical protein
MGLFVCRRRRGPAIAAALAALLVLPAVSAARRDDAPYFTAPPILQGAAVVGSTLRVVATWSGDPEPTATYRWGRCPPATKRCAVIAGATGSSYVATAADVGYRLVAEITLRNAEETLAPVTTPPSGVVVAAPVAPRPPSPVPKPAPAPPAPTTSPPVPIPTSAPSRAADAPPAFLRPFPVIRIRGFFARRGARITLLSVRGPRLAKVNVRCSGEGCPVRSLSLRTAETRVHRFERFLRAGILLQIRVTRRGTIGTYTSFLIRSHKAPLRTDRCLSTKHQKPFQCSAP